MRMRIALPIALLLSACVAVAPAADDKKEHRNDSAKHAGLEKFKQLAGEWVGKEVENGKDGHDVHVKYQVTSAGSAVIETMFPGTAHEMVTVIHQDGDDLALTHYCAIGNQPHMKAPGSAEGNTVAFKFTGASNMKSPKAMHMHDATFTFVDNDTLKSEWTSFDQGQPAMKVVFELKRKK